MGIFEASWGNQTTDEESLFRYLKILSYTLLLHPNTELVMESLILVLKLSENMNYLTTIHSNQEIQYQDSILSRSTKESPRQTKYRKVTTHDNAPKKSVIHQIKVGTVLNYNYETKKELEVRFKKWIHYYNMRRIRTSDNWVTPHEIRSRYIQKRLEQKSNLKKI